MFPMNQKEHSKWSEVRKGGSNKYSFKTALSSTIIVFLMYFLTNAYVHINEIDKYIAYNIADMGSIFVTLLITFVALFFISKIFFVVNEKRFKSSSNNNSKPE
jgi:di/tricarboxylate transporter